MTTPPRSFFEYLRSFGPGIVVVLTWLGAGDIVDMGVAGGNYGYSLMWILVLAIAMRFLFVSLIAKYQLCNHHGEGVLDGLALGDTDGTLVGEALGAADGAFVGDLVGNLVGEPVGVAHSLQLKPSHPPVLDPMSSPPLAVPPVLEPM